MAETTTPVKSTLDWTKAQQHLEGLIKAITDSAVNEDGTPKKDHNPHLYIAKFIHPLKLAAQNPKSQSAELHAKIMALKAEAPHVDRVFKPGVKVAYAEQAKPVEA